MAPQREPGRNCLVADRTGDVWAAVDDGIWTCATSPGDDLSWDQLVEMFGPVEIYIPKTDDGAAPGQRLGGSTPAAAAPSSPGDEAGRPGPDLIGGQPGAASSPLPRSFQLIRHRDVSGVSGTGVIAEGTQWRDGTASLRWYGDHPSTVAWPNVESIVAVHGHQGATELRWLDAPIELWPTTTEGDHP